MADDASSLDSWRLQLEDSNRRFYQKLVESKREFYRDVNDLRIAFGMSQVAHSCDSVVNRAYKRTLFTKDHNKTSAVAEGSRLKPLDDIVRKVEVQVQQMQLLTASMSSTSNFAMDSDQRSEEQTQSDNFQEERAPIQEIKALNQEIESNRQFGWNPKERQFRLEFLETRVDNEVLESAKTDQGIEEPKVIPNLLSGDVSIDSVKIRDPDFRRIAKDCLTTPTVQQLLVESPINLADFRMVTIEFSEFPIAPKVFVEMSSWVESSFVIAATLVKHRVLDRKSVFDPRIAKICMELSNLLKAHAHIDFKNGSAMSAFEGDDFDFIATTGIECCYDAMLKDVRKWVPYDRRTEALSTCCLSVSDRYCKEVTDVQVFVFDPGGNFPLPVISAREGNTTIFIFEAGDIMFIKKGQISFPFDRGRARVYVLIVQLPKI